jgi:hypothetical protein
MGPEALTRALEKIAAGPTLEGANPEPAAIRTNLRALLSELGIEPAEQVARFSDGAAPAAADHSRQLEGARADATIAPRGVGYGETSTADRLQHTFSSYCDAIANRDPVAAKGLVDENTVRTYGGYLDLARQADRAELTQQPPFAQMMALLLRATFSSTELNALDGRQLIGELAQRGLLGGSAGGELTGVESKGKKASAQLGEARLDFALENGDWKLDLTGLGAQLEQAFATVAARENISVQEAMELVTLATVQQQNPTAALQWNPAPA